VDFKHKNVIDFHLNSNKYKKYIKNNLNQSKIVNSFGKQNEKEIFINDLVSMMTSTNIPIEKTNNQEFRAFFTKYCKFGYQIPLADSLRKQIPKVYANKQKDIIKKS
jgi:hypothetical protein